MTRDLPTLTEQHAAGIFAVLDDAFCICEIVLGPDRAAADFRLLEANAAFDTLTGLPDAVGHTALTLFPGLDPRLIALCGAVAEGDTPQRFRQHISALDRDIDVFATPIDQPGHFALILRDVTDARREDDRRDMALAQARALLDELNHRVMNSLAMISSIVAMEARQRRNPDIARPLLKVRDRVHALALLYKTLNASDSVESVQADTYLGAVLDGLRQSVADSADVKITAQLNAVSLATRTAVPLGLVVNELVTNALKYAFRDRDGGTIAVSLMRDGGRLQLVVEDDGVGMGQGLILGSGAGGKLIESLVMQIDGESRTKSTPEGTCVTVWFADVPAQNSEAA